MRILLAILAAVVCAFVVSLLLTISWNPEVSFWHEVVNRRQTALEQIRAESPSQSVIFFAGGSSCAFSISPKIVEEIIGRPVINLGLPISSGPKYILHQALRQAEAGDLIVVCLEPDILTFPDQETSPTKTGFAIEARSGNFTDSAGGSTFDEIPGISDYLSLPRPGAKYLITLVGRSITGKGYRYKENDIGYRGVIRTDERDLELVGAGASDIKALHPEGRILLENFAAAAKAKGVRLAYSMPWYFTDTTALDHNRSNKRQVLAEIATIMPVIEDGFSGAMDGIENFADSALHLSDQGVVIRSEALANALKSHL